MKAINNGFTLIELLIVITIIAGLVSISFPKFTNFTRLQFMKNAVNEFQQAVKLAQVNALNGVVCGENGRAATSWNVEIVDSTRYRVFPICYDNETDYSHLYREYKLVSGVQFDGDEIFVDYGSNSCPLTISQEMTPRIIFKNISGIMSFNTEDFGCPSLDQKKLVITLESTYEPETKTQIFIER